MDLTTIAVIILSLWVVGIAIAGLVMTLRPGGAGIRFAPTAGRPSTDGAAGRGEIPLGGEAEVLGNVRGRVVAVLVNPETRRIEGLQVGRGMREPETVPADAIMEADGQVVSLADGWEDRTTEDGSLAILRGSMSVVGANGKRLGRLRLVCFEPSSAAVTELVVESAGQPSQRLVPMSRVIEAAADRVVTNLPAAESSKLQAFATDFELRQTISQRLGELGVQRTTQVEVRDQRVRIQGYVADRAQAERVEQAIRAVPGVLQLELELVTDAQLAQAVKDAIVRDPGTSAAQVQVVAQAGVVDISGVAPDRATLRRIDAVVQQIEGAQVVHNMVTVRAGTAATA